MTCMIQWCKEKVFGHVDISPIFKQKLSNIFPSMRANNHAWVVFYCNSQWSTGMPLASANSRERKSLHHIASYSAKYCWLGKAKYHTEWSTNCCGSFLSLYRKSLVYQLVVYCSFSIVPSQPLEFTGSAMSKGIAVVESEGFLYMVSTEIPFRNQKKPFSINTMAMHFS